MLITTDGVHVFVTVSAIASISAQDILPFLHRLFLLVGGKRCDLHLAPCLCFRRYAARARASAFFFSSAAFFSAARRLIASIVPVLRSAQREGGSSLCGITICTTFYCATVDFVKTRRNSGKFPHEKAR